MGKTTWKAVSGLVLMMLLTSMLTLAFNIQTAMTEPPITATQEPPPTEWTKTYGGTSTDHAHSVVQTSDGGYAMAGNTDSYGAGYCDAWLVKTDASGNMLWNRTYGGTSDEGAAESVVQTSDGGYALAGSAASYEYSWLVKTDSAGNMLWNRTYGGTSSDNAYSVVQTSDGGYAMAGCTWSYGAGAIDLWLVKTDSAGTMQWNKTFGGADYDLAFSLVQTGDGGYALAGYTSSYGAGGYDFWLVKVGSDLPFTYSLTITAAVGGTTSPAPGTYQYESGEVASIQAWQSGEYQFDHWELDTVNVGSANPYSVTMNTDHTLRAVFGVSTQSPIASFLYLPWPLNPVIGEEITFDASQSKGATSYVWDFGDGHVTSLSEPRTQHSYSTPGTYHVNLTATNSKGQADVTKTITVKKPPVVLVHGFQSSDTYDEDEIWSVMKESLTNSGFTANVSHYAWGAVTSEPIRRYAESLKQEIDQIRHNEEVNKVDIVAHSMGGLVARWYIEFGRGEENVRKLIMLETPNKGTIFPGFTGLLATALGTTLIAGVDPQVKTWADRIGSMVDKIPSWIISDEKKAGLKLLKYAAYVSSNLARVIAISEWPSYIDILAGLPYVDSRIIQNVHYVNIIGWLCRIPKVREVFALSGVATETFAGWVNWHGYLPSSEEIIQKVKFILNDDPEGYNQGMQELQDCETQSTPSISANISQGDEQWHQIAINNATTANFVLVWSEGLLNLTLVSPNGTVIDPSYADPDVAYYYDSNLTIKGYAVKNPNTGIWNVSVLASNILGQSEEYTLLTYLETNATLSLELPKYVFEPNESLDVKANLTYCNQPITGATIEAVIQKPDGLTENITLYDDGSHGDDQMNDGLYTNIYTNTSLSGTYSMVVTATGSLDSKQFAREAFATVWVGQYPDLSLNESDIYFSKETPEEGETITINATIHNIGEIDATNSSILFYDGNPANGTLLGGCTVNVTRGGVETASLLWNATFGIHQISVMISPYSGFQEPNYTNNQANKAITVRGYDITVLAATYPKTVLGQTYEMPVSVTFENRGSFPENLNVTIYANTTIIGKQTIENMPNGTWTTVTFMWNTTGYVKGSYTISAYAEPVSDETHIADNTYEAGIVIVTIPGDVNGDRKVDAADLVDLNKAYGSTFGSPTWNANCDVNGGNKVDVLDLFLHGKNYGKTDP